MLAAVTLCLLFQPTWALASCSQIIPGITRMSSGVDITTLDLEPRDPLSSGGFRRLLFDIECDDGALWTNPYNDRLYEIPNHVQAVYSTSTGATTAVTTLQKSVQDVQDVFKAAVGLSTFIFGMGSGSASYESKLKSVRDNFFQISEVKLLVTTTEAVLKDKINFTAAVAEAITSLPANSTSDYAAYRDLFQKYGTHFIRKAKFGGKIQANFEISQNYYLNHNIEQIKSQAEAAFLKKINTEFQADIETGSENVDSSFEEFTTSETYYYGGSTNILQESGYQDWQPTVAGNPWIMSVEIEKISSFITDKAKVKDLDIAYKIYLAEKALLELEGILNFNLEKYQKMQLNVSILNSLLKEVEHEKMAELINVDSVYQIHDQVYFHFVLPDWWFGFELCLNSFRAQGSGTCYVSSDNKVCAAPEGYTYEYNDNENPQQCEVDAGLFLSHDVDEWAKDTELCFSVGGKSCEFSTNEKCEKANNYLFTGLNKLISQECHVNFSIQSNTQVIPEWFKQIELCLVSYSEASLADDKFDIGCAPLNEWVSSSDYDIHDSDCCIVQLGVFYMFPGNEKVDRIQLEKTTPYAETIQSDTETWKIVVSVLLPVLIPSLSIILTVIFWQKCVQKCQSLFRNPSPQYVSNQQQAPEMPPPSPVEMYPSKPVDIGSPDSQALQRYPQNPTFYAARVLYNNVQYGDGRESSTLRMASISHY